MCQLRKCSVPVCGSESKSTYCEQNIQNDTAAPNVRDSPVVRNTAYDLRCSVVGGTAARVDNVRLHPARKTEVGNLHIVELVKEDVLELKVAVADGVGVQVLDSEDRLPEEAHGSEQIERLLPQHVVEELSALRILEDDVEVVLALKDLDQLEEVRV